MTPEDELPPVLALGGAEDRIIRPFQVETCKRHWNARVVILPNVTHDAMLGPQATKVAEALHTWLEDLQQGQGVAAAFGHGIKHSADTVRHGVRADAVISHSRQHRTLL